jgi:DNA-binding FadR family transcriptional regulator
MEGKNSPSDKVYDFIMNKLKSNEWAPNDKIMTENELSKELDVSRVAVRQAVSILVGQGLLNQKRGAGTFVNSVEDISLMNPLVSMFLLEDKDILSVLEFRMYFEYGNIRMFMKAHDEDDLKKLEGFYDEMLASVNDPERFYVADYNFHNAIAHGTKNPIVIKISDILFEVLLKQQSMLYKNIGPNIGVEYHADILKAIKANDGKIAAMFMKRHIEATIKELSQTLNEEFDLDTFSD